MKRSTIIRTLLLLAAAAWGPTLYAEDIDIAWRLREAGYTVTPIE